MKNYFVFFDATYRKVSDPRYAGNPYIEALPELPSDAVLMRELAVLPRFDPKERDWPAEERIQRLDVLHSLVIPLPRHINFARSVLRMMITGYGPRRPFSQSQNAIARSVYELQQKSGQFTSLHDAPLAAQYSMALFGASGSGKTFMIRQIAGMLPRVIYHPDIGKWQIPFLIIEMSYDGASVHTLASAIFAVLDSLLPDGRYTEVYMERKGHNAEQRLKKALAIAFELGVGFIVVDESQNKSSIGNEPIGARATKRATDRLAKESALIKLLITASNVSHIPLLLTGTLEMKATMMGRFSRARRTAGRGTAVWNPLSCSGSIKNPGEFEFLMMGLFKYQWIRNPIKLSDDWVSIFADYTQGVTDIAVKLWESCQDYAIASGRETIDAEVVAIAFDAEFKTTAYGLHALRTKDRLLLETVTDLFDSCDAERAQFEANAVNLNGVNGAEKAKKKPNLPSPAPEPISIDVLMNADIRTRDFASMDIGLMSGDQWHEDLST